MVKGQNSFSVSVMVSTPTHMMLQWTHLGATAVQGLTQAFVYVCMWVCLIVCEIHVLYYYSFYFIVLSNFVT